MLEKRKRKILKYTFRRPWISYINISRLYCIACCNALKYQCSSFASFFISSLSFWINRSYFSSHIASLLKVSSLSFLINLSTVSISTYPGGGSICIGTYIGLDLNDTLGSTTPPIPYKWSCGLPPVASHHNSIFQGG
jgi:hypothetical protein